MEELTENPMHIMVADHMADRQNLFQHSLAAANYRICTASSALDAWEKLHANRPDLLLLDADLSGETEGLHLVWKLRSVDDEGLRKMPVVIISGLHDRTAVNLFPDLCDGHYQWTDFLPVQGVLRKPVDPADLLKTVSGIVGAAPEPQRSRA